MTSYTHLKIEEREMIDHGISHGLSLRAIAKITGRSHTTISREIRRNQKNKIYIPKTAERTYYQRRYSKGNKISKNPWLRKYILEGLKKSWTPEQIAGRMKKDNKKYYACHETIYDYIYNYSNDNNNLTSLLVKPKKYRKPKRKKRTSIPDLVPVHNRHAPRNIPGHWEGDLMLFRFNDPYTLTTLVERSSRFLIILLNYGKYSKPVIRRITSKFQQLPDHLTKSITFDRGKEFSRHKDIGVDTYFCDPSAPWQKGTNENTNGRIRRFLPKKFKTNNLSQNYLDNIANIMNNTPRKCLGYLTPNEALTNFAKKRCTST